MNEIVTNPKPKQATNRVKVTLRLTRKATRQLRLEAQRQQRSQSQVVSRWLESRK